MNSVIYLCAILLDIYLECVIATGIADTEIYFPHGPILESFDIDMNYGGLVLHFDQPVLANTLDVGDIYLQAHDAVHHSTDLYNFTESVYTNLTAQGNTTDVFFFMGTNDFARLVVHPTIAKDASSVFLSLQQAAFNSSIGVPSEEVNFTSALPVSLFVNDTTSPYVVQFSLDMDIGIITIDFSEPTDPASFSLHGLALQRVRNALYDDAYVPLLHKEDCQTHSDYQRRIICALGSANMNNVKRVPGLSTVINNTYLSGYVPFVNDYSGNAVSILGFERIFGMVAESYVADTTAPTLDSWDLNLNTGQVTLRFSEVIYLPLFNYSGVIICNNATLEDSTVVMRVLDPEIASYLSTENVIIQLNPIQFNFVKYHENLATGSGEDTYLVLEPFLAVDTSALENRYSGYDASEVNARRVSNLTADTISPELEYFEVDLSTQTMLLVFTEVVDITTLNFDEFVFQSAADVHPDTEAISYFNRSMLLSTVDSKEILLDLSELFADIRSRSQLAQSVDTCFVAFTYRFVDDQSGNDVIEIPFNRARQATVFVPDIEPPYLVSWAMDMGTATLVLTFSEPVDIASLLLSALSIQSAAAASRATAVVALSRSSEITGRVQRDVFIQLSYEDVNSIKRSSVLCKSSSTCFLQFGDDLGFDVPSYSEDGMAHNAILPLTSGVPASVYTPDRVAPVLLWFDIDLSLGKLLMTFSEPVNTRSINSTGISFYSTNASTSNYFLSLSSQSFSEYANSDSEEVTLVLTRQDFFVVKQNGQFDAVNNILWMTLGNESFVDSAGNYLDGTMFGESSAQSTARVDDLHFISPLTYGADKQGPSITALKSSKGGNGHSNITIYFNDAVHVSTLRQSYISIASFEAIKVLSLTTARHLTPLTSLTSSLDFSLAPMYTLITSTPPIFVDQANSFVYLQSAGAILDAYGNQNARMSSTAAVRTGPAVVNFLLNMDDGILVLELAYSLSITLSNVDATKFKLMNTNTGVEYTLTTSFTSLDLQDDGYFVHLKISSTDVNNIRTVQLVSTRAETKLEIKSTAIIHSSTIELGKTAVLSCAQLIVDSSEPAVDYFYLNMGTGVLGIQFTEPVVVSSIDLTKMMLGDAAINATNTFRLTNAALTSTTAALTTTYLVEINLNAGSTHPTDRDQLHISDTIGRTILETNLIIDPGFAYDTSVPPNYVTSIDISNARTVSTLLSDRTPPTLLSYDFDLTTRKMTMVFSEAVNATTTKVSHFTFLASANAPSANLYTLTTKSAVSPETKALVATAVVVINLSEHDVDNIMLQYPFLCTSSSDTQLAFPTGAIKDLAFSSNSIEQVFKIYAKKVTNYVADTKVPELLYFDMSMHSSEVDFYFDEMVNCFATDVGKISFQTTAFIGTLTQRYTLTSTSSYLIGCEASNYITRSIKVYIGREDLVRIKTYMALLKSAAATKLYLDQGAFFDITGNMISAARDGHVIEVRNYTGDTTSPRLMGFIVNTDRVMRVKFSEPIKISSLDVTKIQNHNSRSATISYQLKKLATTVGGIDRNLMTVKFDMATDYDYMVGVTNIFKSQNTSFLSVTSDCITDTSGNPLAPITMEQGLNMGPTVTDWDLNLNTGELSLYFSHRVSTSFSINGVTIQDSASSPAVEVLVSSTPQDMSVIDNDFFDTGTAFVVELSSVDITALKLSRMITPTGENLYLSVPLGLTVSPVANTIVRGLLSTATLFAVRVGEFVFDRTGPVVTGIELDLNNGLMIISFDEPVLGMSLDVSKIALLSNAFGNSIALTNLMAPVNVNTSTIRINITHNDLNIVKYSHAIGTLDKVLFDIDFVADLFGNYAEGDDDLNGEKFIVDIDTFTPDSTDPHLLTCFVDLSSSLITLQFDEIMDMNSIAPYHIDMYSADHTAPHIRNMTLTNYSILEADILRNNGNITVDMSLFRQDAFAFQQQTVIGKNSSVTYIRVYGARDVGGNPHDSAAVVQCQVGTDGGKPRLESFDFFSNGGNFDITLYFSEVLDISTFACADFSFASLNSASASEKISLVNGDCTVATSVNAREITFSVAASLFATIGSTVSSTWVYAPNPLSTADISGNLLYALPVTDAHRVGPRVVNYVLDLESGNVGLIFSKDIDVGAAFNSSGVGIYSMTSGHTFFLEDGTASVSGYFGTEDNSEFVVSVDLVATNINGVKYIDIDKDSAVLVLRDNVFVDSDGISSPLLDKDRMLTPARFTKDEDSPQILHLEMDMSLNRLVMTFDEPIRLSTVSPAKMTLQDSPGSLTDLGLVSYSLTGGTLDQQLVGGNVLMTLHLTDDDSGNIKLLPNISKGASSVFLSMRYTPMQDMAGNSLATIFPATARAFEDYVIDTTAPILRSFSLDMNIGELKLQFSEPISANSVNTSLITLQSRFSRDLQGYRHSTLTADSVVTSANGFVITILIGAVDMYSIKNTDNLARKRISTYLSCPSSAAEDLAGNKMVSIIDGEALPVSTFTQDSTVPHITDIKLDMSAETLTFYFSELIWTRSADITSVTVQEGEIVGFGYNYTFTSSSNTLNNAASQFSTFLEFQLAPADVNSIKWRRPLGNSRDYSFFIVKSGLCYDVFQNSVQAISARGAQASSFVADFDPPVLLHYTLNMNTLTLHLEYSESVLQDSITLGQGIMQRTETKRFGNYVNLSFSSALVGKDMASNFVTITIDPWTSYEMKWYKIALSLDSSFFTWGSEFVADGYGNYIDPLWDGSVLSNHPVLPESYTPDTTSPTLTKWFLDRDEMKIYLLFSEPVVMNACSGVSIQVAGLNASFGSCVPTYRDFGSKLILDPVMLINGVFLADLASSIQGTLYLSITENALQDLAAIPNPLLAVEKSVEGGPVCSDCEAGFFMSAMCTASVDRVCSKCSSCGTREWIVNECGIDHDTACMACSDCPYGQYISAHCDEFRDTQCTVCTTCGSMQFKSRDCSRGFDALCDSCEHCSFDDPRVELACKDEKYFWWNKQHCCWAKNGKQVPCSILSWVEMQITTTDGHQDSVFDTTSPPVYQRTL